MGAVRRRWHAGRRRRLLVAGHGPARLGNGARAAESRQWTGDDADGGHGAHGRGEAARCSWAPVSEPGGACWRARDTHDRVGPTVLVERCRGVASRQCEARQGRAKGSADRAAAASKKEEEEADRGEGQSAVRAGEVVERVERGGEKKRSVREGEEAAEGGGGGEGDGGRSGEERRGGQQERRSRLGAPAPQPQSAEPDRG